MLSRIFSITIVLFWLTMTGWLVRSELWPDYSSLRMVPVSKVAKLMWFHHEPSDLVISAEGKPVGHFRLHPKIRESDGTHILEYSGNIQLRLPGSPRQRISWDGVAEFDPDLQMHSVLLGLGLKQLSTDRAEIVVTPAENLAHLRVLDVSGREMQRGDYTLDEKGLKKILTEVDFDPALYDTFRPGRGAAPSVTAQESSILIHHERTKTYLVEVRQGGQTLMEAHISELGQVLRVKTLVGYSLAPDDLIP